MSSSNLLAMPREIKDDVLKRALRGGKRVNFMLVNKDFLAVSLPLCYRSMTLHSSEMAFKFLTMLAHCESRKSSIGPRPSHIIHLRFDFEFTMAPVHKVITSMSSLRSITTEFQDCAAIWNLGGFVRILDVLPPSVNTFRFISIEVNREKVSIIH